MTLFFYQIRRVPAWVHLYNSKASLIVWGEGRISKKTVAEKNQRADRVCSVTDWHLCPCSFCLYKSRSVWKRSQREGFRLQYCKVLCEEPNLCFLQLLNTYWIQGLTKSVCFLWNGASGIPSRCDTPDHDRLHCCIRVLLYFWLYSIVLSWQHHFSFNCRSCQLCCYLLAL